MNEFGGVERIARVETRLEILERELRRFEEQSVGDRKELRELLTEIAGKLDKQRTFVGGMIFVLSGLFAFIGVFKDWLLTHVK